MKKITLLLSLAMLSMAAMASGKWALQGVEYTVDTLAHVKVGPGTTQTSLKLTGTLDLRVFYTTTDLSDKNVQMRVVKAKDKILATATVPVMATTNSKPGELYFAGVNADFFNMTTGQPNGTNVINSEVYNIGNGANWLEWSIDESKTPYLGKLSFSGNVKRADGTSCALSNINSGRGQDELILYTSRFSSNTGTNAYGSEVLLTPVESGATISLGKSVKMKVTGAPATAGSMAIPAGSYVLSGHGTSDTFVNGLTDGEELEVSMSATTAEGKAYNPVWSVGGCPVLLKGGVVQETENANIIDHLPTNQPRTAIGYDATGTKVVLLVVDGRNPGVSDGCRTKVLADIMKQTGCTEAMNFDGGGSSTLYVKNLGTNGVCNVPSGGALRAVTNGVYAVAVCPDDSEIAEIRFKDLNKTLPKYGYYTPSGFYGYNKYGVLVSTDVKGVKLSCPSGLGEIVNDGATLNANGSGSHVLKATYNGCEASLIVTVENTSPKLKVPAVTFAGESEYSVEVLATVSGEDVVLDNNAFTWSSDDESVATVDAAGVVKSLKAGKAKITGVVDTHKLELAVNVEVPDTRFRAIDKDAAFSTWSIKGANIESASVTEKPGGGIVLNFTPTATKQVNVTAVNSLPSWSRPDSISIGVNPGAAKIQYVYILGIDQSNPSDTVEYKVKVSGKVLQNQNNKVDIAMSEVLDTSYAGSYPFLLTGIKFSFLTITKEAHKIELPKVSWVYNSVPGSSAVEGIEAGEKSALQLSPNPVESGSIVRFGVSEAVSYAVSSLNGAVVKQGTGVEVSTEGLSSGIYLVSVKTAEGVKAARLIVK